MTRPKRYTDRVLWRYFARMRHSGLMGYVWLVWQVEVSDA